VEIYGPLIRLLEGGEGKISMALERNQKEVSSLQDHRYRNLLIGGTGSFLLVVASPLSDLFVASIYDCNAQLALAQVQLALRQYELSTGGLPERLEEIGPLLSAGSTQDPWTSEPLMWNSETRKLYSKGRNGLDDDGQTERVAKKKKPLDFGDLYWWPRK
jgi:hypothetical protein